MKYLKLVLLWIIIFIFLLRCSSRTPKYRYYGAYLYFMFIDSLGNDYVKSRNIKPDEVYIVFYEPDYIYSGDPTPKYILKNHHYLFRLNCPDRTNDIILKIGDKVEDTLKIVKKNHEMDGYNLVHYGRLHNRSPYIDPIFHDTTPGMAILKYLYYNGRRLAPPQFDADGNVHVHRIVVREDF